MPTLVEAYKEYARDYVWAHGFKEKTAKNYRWAVDSLESVIGPIALEDITIEHIYAWRQDCEEKSWEHNSINAYLYRFRLFFGYFHKKGICNLDPSTIIVPKMKKTLPKYLNIEQLIRLMDVADTREKALISLLYSSGIRVGELVKIRKRDIYENTIKIRGKGGKERIVFLDSSTIILIDRYLQTRKDSCEALFYSRKCRHLSRHRVEFIVKQLGLKAGLKTSVTPHMFRHTAATQWLKGGMNLRYIQELLGHADISTTQIYTHVAKDDLAKVYEEHHQKIPLMA